MTRSLAFALLTSSALLPCAALAQSLPTEGRVVRGEATIHVDTPQGMTIRQGSDRAVIDWSSFSVAQDARIDILQNDHRSALLNRVTGDTSSNIAGQISANGQVYLVNPNGILITPTGSVKAAGFVASTLDLSNDAFMAGDITVTGRGGRVTNAGTISIVKGGYAALLGGRVENNGVILAPLGKVAIGSASRATLDLEGDGFLQVALPAAGADAGIYIPGRIVADGGAVVLAAGQAREAARGVVNLSGAIEARGLEGRSGAVTLTGGDIVLAGASIDVSGAGGGGAVRIGGDWQGGGTLTRAQTLTVDAATTIRADALESGDGGRVVLWSDRETRFAGSISARGAGAAGRGGDVEVSGKAWLEYAGAADLRGRAGFGHLLLDPYNVTISTAVGRTSDGFTASGNDSIINATTLLTALGRANVTVQTGTGGSQAGNITVAAPLAWNSGATLTLQAAGGIALNAPITAQAGGLTLHAGGTISATREVSIARFTLLNGDWRQVAPTLPAFATADFRLIGGSFVRAVGGSGLSGDPYRLTDIYGLQGMATQLSGHFLLANDIDARGTKAWNDGAGFASVGRDSARFTGGLDGAGHIVEGLTINRPIDDNIGMIGYLGAGGSLTRIGLVGAAIRGNYYVGALVGTNGGTVSNAYATGSTTGNVVVGGLIGTNLATMANTHAAVAVSGGDYVGGLAGWTQGAVRNSYATGSVTGNAQVGGLAGYAFGEVSNVYASGAVRGSTNVGGLSGFDGSRVSNSYWDIDTTGQATTSGGGTGLTTAQARNAGSYIGFDFANTWYHGGDLRPILRSESVTGRALVGGYMEDVYFVSNLHQLQLMGADLTGKYLLTRDIDALATNGADAAGIFGVGGFVPVGSGNSTSSTAFAGRLVGDRHVIRNLVIDRPGQDYVGLLGSTKGSVMTVGLEGGSITGRNYVGALVGASANSIFDNYSTADVIGRDYVGGLIGQAAGEIRRNYATGTVSGIRDVGGLIGTNGGYLLQSYATGAVNGTSSVGGLVGSSMQEIRQSYALGSVSGDDMVGGLVGSSFGSGRILESYAAGRVIASVGQAGGLLGNGTAGITNSFWDSGTTQQSFASGSGAAAGATGLTTAEARSGNYTGFDFNSVWYQTGDLRPILRSEAVTDANGVYQISNLHQLQLMGANLGSSHVLTRDIDATATDSVAASSGIFGASGFVPVGTTFVRFAGALDGAGHTITGLTITRYSSDYVGLIGSLDTRGTVTNIGLLGGRVAGLSNVGGLVGANSGTVSNAYTTGTVAGSSFVGGLVGINQGTVREAYASGAVSGIGDVGGLVGFNGRTLSNVYASGAVTGLGGTANLGGLVGSNLGSVSNAYASGTVTGSASAMGGLAGLNNGGILTNTFWDVTTTGRGNAVGSGGATGATGLTTAQMQDATGAVGSFNVLAKAGGWDFASVWAPGRAGGYAQLYALSDAVTVTVADATRVYGDSGVGLMASYYGLRPGEFVTGLASVASGVTERSAVGRYAVTTTGGTVTALDDHAVNLVHFSGIETVIQRALEITVLAGQSRKYGYANNLLAFSVGGLGLVNGDNVSGALSTDAMIESDVGSYGVRLGTLTAGGNYAISLFPGGTMAVTPREITVVADALSRKYGFANGALAYTVGGDGLYGSDSLGGALGTNALIDSDVGSYEITQGTLSGGGNYSIGSFTSADLVITPREISIAADALSRKYGFANGALAYTVGGDGLYGSDALGGALATNAVIDSDVGSYAITQGTLSAGGNYIISGFTDAALTINPREISIAANALSRKYGYANGALGYTIGGEGLYGSDALSGALATNAVIDSDVGSYAITQGTLSAGGNYSISGFTDAALTINPREISIAANALSRKYGFDNPALSYTIGGDGLYGSDALTGELATRAAIGSDVGSYAITQGSLDGGRNYLITSFKEADLTVATRTLAITANAASRTYGDVNPMLNYTITGGDGLYRDDILGLSLSTDASTRSNVGSYAIYLDSTANRNYTVTFTGANLSVVKRAVTVRADALYRVYGDDNPVLTYAVAGLVNGDQLSGALATSADLRSNVGSYAIGQGTLDAGSNYALVYVDAALSVKPRAITVTADNAFWAYGQPEPALTWTISGMGLVNGDRLLGLLESGAAAASIPGLYPILQGSLHATPNYSLTFVPGMLEIQHLLSAPLPSASGISRDWRFLGGSVGDDLLLSSDSAILPLLPREAVRLP